MVESRAVKLIHLPLFSLLTVVTLITMAIAASLVAHWNNFGYPNTSLRDRSRILLVAAIWTLVFAIYLTVGVIFAATSFAFGILVHLISLTIGFILFLIGAASITASMRNVDCGNVPDTFSRCNVTKGLYVMSWISTIVVFIALLFVFFIGVKARSGAGMRRGNLVEA